MAETVSADESASGDPAFLPWNQMHVRKILNGSPLRGMVLFGDGKVGFKTLEVMIAWDERPLPQGAGAHVAQISKRRALWRPNIACGPADGPASPPCEPRDIPHAKRRQRANNSVGNMIVG